MTWLIIVGLVLLVCFAGVLLFGAPYLPTLKPQIKAALELADLKPGDTLIELGCGDGRVLIAAARQGYKAVGYELNPLLALIAWLRTHRYRRQVRVVWGDFWRAEWPPSAAIFTFLLPRYMTKLDRRCRHYPHKPIKLVSFAFKIEGKPVQARKSGIFLYEYGLTTSTTLGQ
jgi:SAM-dependent methyltransferase